MMPREMTEFELADVRERLERMPIDELVDALVADTDPDLGPSARRDARLRLLRLPLPELVELAVDDMVTVNQLDPNGRAKLNRRGDHAVRV